VVIISILASIGIWNFIHLQNRAREAAVKSNGHSCQMAVESYAAINEGSYPPAATAMADISQNLPGGNPPTNPFNGNPGLSIGTGPAEGMCDYLDPVAVGEPNAYRIDCFGTNAMPASLSNG
jgi:type II secretory pathway pseudopilin PulG